MRIAKEGKKEIKYEIIAYVIAIAIVSFFWVNNVVTFLLLLMLWIIAAKVWHEKQDISLFIMSAIGGSIGEIICIYFGVWTYNNASFLGIPLWLPLLLGFSSVMIKRVAHTVTHLKN